MLHRFNSVKAIKSNPNSLVNHVVHRDAYPVKWRGQSVRTQVPMKSGVHGRFDGAEA